MMGSMRTRVTDRKTDGRTDRAGYIGPAERQSGSNKRDNKEKSNVIILLLYPYRKLYIY